MGNPREPVILVAEDDLDDWLFLREALEESPHEARLEFVEDGEELLSYLRREGPFADPARFPDPDIILLDLNMPKKDGREALADLKGDEKLRNIPVVVFSTSQEENDVLLTYQLKAASFIAKPMTFGGWLSVIAALFQYWSKVASLPEGHSSS
ncbi:MAG: response regulator [Proteobacteria bacterium]|nr:response regulator [Pseudomonadota bacterium]